MVAAAADWTKLPSAVPYRLTIWPAANVCCPLAELLMPPIANSG